MGTTALSVALGGHAVTYAHGSEADFAGSELARLFAADPALCYDPGTLPVGVSASATAESAGTRWPFADGLISLLETGNTRRGIALEYKRPNEGVHGLLTGMGQVYAYLHKGYNGAVLVVPKSYPTHSSPASYLRSVLDQIKGSEAVGVFDYDPPDTTSPTPFAGRLHCVRPLRLLTTLQNPATVTSGTTTQWAHVREGSTTRDAFLKFLQIAKTLSAGQQLPAPSIPAPLVAAIKRLEPTQDAASYLANTADDRLLTRVWKNFWFQWLVTPNVLTPWLRTGDHYVTPNATTAIMRDDQQGFSQMFEGRSNGLKETLVGLLNAGTISEGQAWEYFAQGFQLPGAQRKQGVRDRAHSYREDIDSSLLQLEWIDADGLPTEQGYKFMSICERYGGPNSPASMEYIGATLLQTGGFAAFLHYVSRLSERKFSADPLAFTREAGSGRPIFSEQSYTEDLA